MLRRVLCRFWRAVQPVFLVSLGQNVQSVAETETSTWKASDTFGVA